MELEGLAPPPHKPFYLNHLATAAGGLACVFVPLFLDPQDDLFNLLVGSIPTMMENDSRSLDLDDVCRILEVGPEVPKLS